jgi:anthranilate/para-aminobenzoate synthase component I
VNPPFPWVPFLKKVDLPPDPLKVYRAMKTAAPSVLLESARTAPRVGSFSFIGSEPFLIFEAEGLRVTLRDKEGVTEKKEGNPFRILRRIFRSYPVRTHPLLPPFVGGAIGYFGYEVKNILEPRLLVLNKEDAGLPDIYLLFFDEGVLFDHRNDAVYLFCAVPEIQGARRCAEAASRKIRRLEEKIVSAIGEEPGLRENRPEENNRAWIQSSLSREAFVRIVAKAKDFIRRGDIFQANLSQRLSFELNEDPLGIYARLRAINPSAFFGFLDAGDFQIVSGSPERLLKLENGFLETRPIAGTRPRGATPLEDAAVSADLILNEKERAEHLMLVDLERNDLGRVSEYGSVSVDEMMVLEDYSHVKHIVSNIRGVLRPGFDMLDAFASFFPGGTITGTPKFRAMDIIEELEPVRRGPYTGSLGYFSFTGNMDFNILIRSLVVKGQKGCLHVGAGIVADSDPEKEYDETLYKAEAVLSACFGARKAREFFVPRGT